MCNYTDSQVAKPVSHIMNTYKNEQGQTAIINSNEQTIENDNGTWILQKPDGSQELALVAPKTSAAAKALAEASAPPVSFEGEVGNPITGLAKGATVIGNPGATAPVLPNVK